MMRAGSTSWHISTGFDRHGARMLYVRDAAGLAGPADYPVPRLSPEVGLRAGLAPYATENAVEQWHLWWTAYLDGLGRGGAVRIGPESAPPPDPGTDLRALYELVVDEANEWLRERYREFNGRTLGPARQRMAQPQEVVRRIGRTLGRELAPFALDVRVLPLERKWGRRIDGGLVLVSEALWTDPVACDAFLEPVVRSLA